MTLTNDERKGASAPLAAAEISFLGDTAYPTGGSTGFQALVRTLLQRNVTILAVVPVGLSIYTPIYDKANDTLIMVEGTAGANAEVGAATAMDGITFKLLVLYF